MKITKQDLVKAAVNAMKNAYSPYSNYNVGAALLAGSGKMYTGVNVENASYGLTICAERNAIFNAVNNGEKVIKAIAIAGAPSAAEKSKINAVEATPCGACRQVIAEFAKPDTPVYIANFKAGKVSKIISRKLRDYLPHPFGG